MELTKKYHAGDSYDKQAREQNRKVYYKCIINLVDDPLILEENWEFLFPDLYNNFAKPGAGQGKMVFKVDHAEGEMLYDLIQKKANKH